ncbi:autoinducer 2 ABC transporter substrate-binding protein [Paenibacillus harenae]|uniref:autoinducer 2 ABC transporter substrate-binding protein n=1 Tax=Paenibacillus harenae TaxID=306543 RepID=UPI0004140AE0|nr:autoinducer 2 ABC transporter substrate-binding protein [Paenibacillus harenae]
MNRLLRLHMILLSLVFVSACLDAPSKGGYKVIYSMESGPSSAPSSYAAKNNESDYIIGVVPKVMDIPYFNVVETGVMEAAEDLGVEVIYEGPPIADTQRQIKIIQDLIDRQVDALAISANDPEKLLPVLMEAKQKGIQIITWDSDTVREGRQFFVNMVDPETLGRHLMDTLAWNTAERGEFAIMTGSASAATLNEWIKWMLAQQQEFYPGMKLLEITATDDDPQRAYEAASRLLADHPGLAGIIGISSVAPPAAAQAVKEAGMLGRVKTVGLSTPTLMAGYLHDGSAQVATLWSPKKLGYLTVVLAKNLLDGKKPYNGQDIDNVGNIRVNGDHVIMGEPVDFTKENVDQYDF